MLTRANAVRALPLFALLALVSHHYPSRAGHILRLLATHHVLTETAPDVFAANRISGYMDTGKSWGACAARSVLCNFGKCGPLTHKYPSPETKYQDTNGIAAFVGLWCG